MDLIANINMIKELVLGELRMIGNPVVLDKCIFYYEDVIDFAEDLKILCINNSISWKINNEDASRWEPGKKILGYDEYEINLSFDSDYKWIKAGKIMWDLAKKYSSVNLTNMSEFEKPTVRIYSPDPGFLEIESLDEINPSRKFSSILFLNDCNNGGDISFRNFNVSVQPKIGSAIFFPSSFSYSLKINKPKESKNFFVFYNFI
jgi:hypothetical protein